MKQYSCSTASGAIKALEGCLAVAVNHVMAAPVSPTPRGAAPYKFPANHDKNLLSQTLSWQLRVAHCPSASILGDQNARNFEARGSS